MEMAPHKDCVGLLLFNYFQNLPKLWIYFTATS